jgi:V/A-type H+-transporting ATPase subunit A
MSEHRARARVTWISGPVLHARTEGSFRLREAIRVGPAELLGEVIRIENDEIVCQVYEDTTGLMPGVPVEGTGALLGIRVGPALLGRIFDGLMRPLQGTGSRIAPGMQAPPQARLQFTPSVSPGDTLAPGHRFGRLQPGQGREQLALAAPTVGGLVRTVQPAGEYSDDATLVTLVDADGAEHALAMSHFWPVRTPRPVLARLPSDEPLVTGQRVLDSLFPVALGGKGAIPGGFGTGKTILLESLAKGCNADVIVYLGCGERGNELAGVLEEFPQLEDPRTGRALMERTVIIANTSNMPVAAREASIYSAVTVAEFFRDQGLHVALMADSTSRWAEALREVSSRFGELPGEGGYPTYLSSRIADFYERAAKVRTLAGSIGSVTLLGSISPPSGDFSEPVTSHTKRYVRSYWALDPKRAQARFYPAVNPLQSYSEDSLDMASWWQEVYASVPTARARRASGTNEWLELRRQLLTLLDEQARLERMARIIGKDALPARQRLALACAELANEALLRQSAFSPVDHYCGPQRQACMLRLLIRFFELAEAATARGVVPEQITGMSVMRPLARMGEDIGEQELDRFAALEARVEAEFATLANSVEAADAAYGHRARCSGQIGRTAPVPAAHARGRPERGGRSHRHRRPAAAGPGRDDRRRPDHDRDAGAFGRSGAGRHRGALSGRAGGVRCRPWAAGARVQRCGPGDRRRATRGGAQHTPRRRPATEPGGARHAARIHRDRPECGRSHEQSGARAEAAHFLWRRPAARPNRGGDRRPRAAARCRGERVRHRVRRHRRALHHGGVLPPLARAERRSRTQRVVSKSGERFVDPAATDAALRADRRGVPGVRRRQACAGDPYRSDQLLRGTA